MPFDPSTPQRGRRAYLPQRESLILQSSMARFLQSAQGQPCPQCSIGPFERDWISRGTRCSAQIVPSSQSLVIGCSLKQN